MKIPVWVNGDQEQPEMDNELPALSETVHVITNEERLLGFYDFDYSRWMVYCEEGEIVEAIHPVLWLKETEIDLHSLFAKHAITYPPGIAEPIEPTLLTYEGLRAVINQIFKK